MKVKNYRKMRATDLAWCIVLLFGLGVFLLYYDRITPVKPVSSGQTGQDSPSEGQLDSSSFADLTVTAQKIVMEDRQAVSNTPVQVTFSGSYHHKLLGEKNRWFSGNICIEGIRETEWEMRDVVFTTDESETLYGWMYYENPKPSQWSEGIPYYDRIAVAMLYMTHDASQFIIWMGKEPGGSFSSHEGILILSPGMSFEYALEHDPYP